jgi:hypothetical protein
MTLRLGQTSRSLRTSWTRPSSHCGCTSHWHWHWQRQLHPGSLYPRGNLQGVDSPAKSGRVQIASGIPSCTRSAKPRMAPVLSFTATSMSTWTGWTTVRTTWQCSPSPSPSARPPPAWKRTTHCRPFGHMATLPPIRQETSHVRPETLQVLQEVGHVPQEVCQVRQEVDKVRQEVCQVRQATFTSTLGWTTYTPRGSFRSGR